jgi:hypothetical protein
MIDSFVLVLCGPLQGPRQAELDEPGEVGILGPRRE